jgi:NADPH:quinone reductase-like Zn-dependent oxidoreductase
VVQAQAASINYPDLLMIGDRYQVSVPPPFTPGSEFAGVVCAVGEGVDTVAVGQRVATTSRGPTRRWPSSSPGDCARRRIGVLVGAGADRGAGHGRAQGERKGRHDSGVTGCGCARQPVIFIR